MNRLLWLVAPFASLIVAATAAQAPEPDFTFGALADIQYGDKDTSGARRYREATAKLARCVADWNKRELAFTVQLGDIIDGRKRLEDSRADFQTVLAELGKLEHTMHHVIGNHCLSIPRKELMDALGLGRAYYDFKVQSWRFIVLDGMDINILEPNQSKDERKRVRAFLKQHPRARKRLAAVYNGGVGAAQVAWFRDVLNRADAAREKVIVFCHLPVLAAAADTALLLWNHKEIHDLLERHGCAQAFFCGHHHAGGYARSAGGVHHVTLQGMVNAPEKANAYALVEVSDQSLGIRGFGTVPSRELSLREAPIRLRIVCDAVGEKAEGGQALVGHQVHCEVGTRRFEDAAALSTYLKARANAKSRPRVIIEPGKNVTYGDIAAVIDLLQQAGFSDEIFFAK